MCRDEQSGSFQTRRATDLQRDRQAGQSQPATFLACPNSSIQGRSEFSSLGVSISGHCTLRRSVMRIIAESAVRNTAAKESGMSRILNVQSSPYMERSASRSVSKAYID